MRRPTDVGRPVGILIDLPGPKVRSAPFADDGVLARARRRRAAHRGAARRRELRPRSIAVALAGAVDSLVPGDRVALGDGGVALVVTERGARRRAGRGH